MIKKTITRTVAVLTSTLILLVLSPGSAMACGINYDSGSPSPADGCGGTAAAVSAATVLVGAGAAAVVLAVRSFLRGGMSAEELRNYLDTLKTQDLWQELWREGVAPLDPALSPGRELEELADQAAEHSRHGRATEAAEVTEELTSRLEEPIRRTGQAVSSASRAVEKTGKAMKDVGPGIMEAVRVRVLSRTDTQSAVVRQQVEGASKLLDSARDTLAAADSTLAEAQQAHERATEDHQKLVRVAAMLRSTAATVTEGARGDAETLPSTLRALTEHLSTARRQSVESLTLASAVDDRLTLADDLARQVQDGTTVQSVQQHTSASDPFGTAARGTIMAEAAEVAAKIHLQDRIPAFNAARNATARAHELAYMATQAALHYRTVGSPSLQLDTVARDLAKAAEKMTELSDVILRGGHQRVQGIAHDLQNTASDVVRDAARVADLMPPLTERSKMFGASTHDKVNALARELGFELLNIAGRVPRIGSGSIEAARFLRAARGRRTGLAQAQAIGSPGPPPRPEADPLRRVKQVPEVMTFGQRFAPQGTLAPDTDYQVRHEHSDGQIYQATYRTNEQSEIVEIWTPSGYEIHQGAAPGTKDSGNPELQDPRPNCVYHVDDRFTYVTDEHGRTVMATGIVKPGSAARYDTQKSVGHEGNYEFPPVTFNGGHIFASEFGGPGENINLVPEMQYINMSHRTQERPVRTFLENWRRFEQELGERARNAEEVHLTVELPRYGKSRTPSGFLATYVVNGVRQPPRPFVNFPRSSVGPGRRYPIVIRAQIREEAAGMTASEVARAADDAQERERNIAEQHLDSYQAEERLRIAEAEHAEWRRISSFMTKRRMPTYDPEEDSDSAIGSP